MNQLVHQICPFCPHKYQLTKTDKEGLSVCVFFCFFNYTHTMFIPSTLQLRTWFSKQIKNAPQIIFFPARSFVLTFSYKSLGLGWCINNMKVIVYLDQIFHSPLQTLLYPDVHLYQCHWDPKSDKKKPKTKTKYRLEYWCVIAVNW